VIKLVSTVLVFMLLLAACQGAGQTGRPQDSGGGEHDMDMGVQSAAFGEPGDRSKADRTIDVTALDSLEFAPETLKVKAGETVTFVVTNNGKDAHEFVLGDENYQEEHAAEMSGNEDMATDQNWMELEPGETNSLTWTFTTESAEVLYGCHEPGHYEGGMVGRVEVAS
jgi:uncharacterized cupredoxin-like copper-binding protein